MRDLLPLLLAPVLTRAADVRSFATWGAYLAFALPRK